MINVAVDPVTRVLTASEKKLIVRNDHKIEDIRFDIPAIFPAQSNWALWDSGSENGALPLGMDNTLEVTRGLTGDGKEFKCALRVVSSDGEVWNSLAIGFKVKHALDVDADAPPADDPTALEQALEQMAEYQAGAHAAEVGAGDARDAAEAAAGSVHDDAEAAAASAEAAQLAETGAKEAETQAEAARDGSVAAAGQAEAAKVAAQQSATNAAGSAAAAEASKEGLNSPDALATTLPPGAPATAYWDVTGAVPVLRLGIPRGWDGTGTGDMHTSIYDPTQSGVVLRAAQADALAEGATIELEQVDGLGETLNGKVPANRKVNGKTLDADVTLDAGDVGARPADWKPAIADVEGLDGALAALQPKPNTNDYMLLAAAWTAIEHPDGAWQQTINVPGLLVAQDFNATFAPGSKNTYLGAGVSALDTTEDGKVVFVATDKPVEDITVRIEVK